MNFRSCKYFLTVCQAGTVSAAAKQLYISQQSLSEHIRKLEKELGVRLFHRDNPLTLTEAGHAFYLASVTITQALNRLDAELDAIKETDSDSLVIGCMDYGTPDFIPALTKLFLEQSPRLSLRTQELLPQDPVPKSIPLVISSHELPGFLCETLITDSLVVCVRDSLLQRLYGSEWMHHRDRLHAGDLSALEGCPFFRHRSTPLEKLSENAFRANHFSPEYLPVTGSTAALMNFCSDGQGAIITLEERASHIEGFPPAYRLANVPEKIPTCFICRHPDTELSPLAKSFLAIARSFFRDK